MKNANTLKFMGAVLVALGTASCTHTYYLGELAVLRGEIVAEPFFGPPNYGESPDKDQREVAYIMRLDPPITIVDSSARRRSVSEIQIIECVRHTTDRTLSVRGQIGEASSGHHRRDFILFCGR